MRLGYNKNPFKPLLYFPICNILLKVILDCVAVTPSQPLILPPLEGILVCTHICWGEGRKPGCERKRWKLRTVLCLGLNL